MTQFISIKSEQENITTDTKEIQNIIGEYFKNWYSIKLKNMEKYRFCLIKKKEDKNVAPGGKLLQFTKIKNVERFLSCEQVLV